MQTWGLSESHSLTVQSAPADRNARCTWPLQASEYTANEWPAKLCWYLRQHRLCICTGIRDILTFAYPERLQRICWSHRCTLAWDTAT